VRAGTNRRPETCRVASLMPSRQGGGGVPELVVTVPELLLEVTACSLPFAFESCLRHA
jgi:hypothetical protein